MARRHQLSGDQRQELKKAMNAARTLTEWRRPRCVWLYHVFGWTAFEVGRALGFSKSGVRQVLERFRRLGAAGLKYRAARAPAPAAAPRGGWRSALRRAVSLDEFRLVQCVALGELLGLNGRQVTAAVGWSGLVVNRVRSAYRRRGEAALLPRRGEPLDESAAERLRVIMGTAHGAGEFRRAQCVYLRAVLGLSVKLTARVLGWSRREVWRIHQGYLRRGEAALWGPGRGGARRRQLLTRDQVAEVLRALARERPEYGLLLFPAIQAAMEAKAGRPLDSAYVQSILDRHGWCRAAVVTIPYQATRNLPDLAPDLHPPAAPNE